MEKKKLKLLVCALAIAWAASPVAMGSPVLLFDAGEDQTFLMRDGSLQLNGTVTGEAETIEWTQEFGPGTAWFSNDAIEDPTVTFSEAGTYILRLTAYATTGQFYDEVTITVENPTCQDAIDDGLLMAGDLSGPEWTPDCYIDMYDFAAFADNWLRCNNPQDPQCEFLFDTMAQIYDELTITVENPTCQDVIDNGLMIMGDLSGPEWTPDCYINLYDFAAFAGNWLRCNNPQDPQCEFPY